jgi:hypothetical protein
VSAREIDDLLLHIRGLVVVREILEQRGASAAELEEHTAELERLKHRLARLAVSQADTTRKQQGKRAEMPAGPALGSIG